MANLMVSNITQEDKELLLRDLSARLSYGVKCKYYDCCEGDYEEGTICGFEREEYMQIDGVCIRIEEVKPYLLPLSSMTEEQTEELIKLINTGQNDNNEFMRSLCRIDFYHKHHFDYRGLIPMGLAIDATNLRIYE